MGRVLPFDRHSPEYGGFCSFADCRLMYDERVATPAKFLWHAYRMHCRENGFPAVRGRDFMVYLGAERRLRVGVFGAARGDLKSYVHGCSLRK